MQAKIIFLGVGGDSYIVGKQVLSSGGIIIRLDNMQFHIDPGPGSLVKAKQYELNLRENTALFVSHSHINHSNDTNSVIAAMTHNGDDKRGVLITNQVVNDEVLIDYYKNCLERVMVMEPGKKAGIGNVDVMATKTKHANGIGFKFFTQNFVISYVGDTEYSKEIAEGHVGSDIVILNIVNPSGFEVDGQMSTDGAIEFLKKVKPSLAIITHYGVKMLSADPINEARKIQKESLVQVIAAKDGMVLNPYNYSAVIKQKTLNSF